MNNSITPANLGGLIQPSQDQTKTDRSAKQGHEPAPHLADYRDQFSPSSKGIQAAAFSERYESQYAYSNTMSLSLTTREGDQVQVDFRQLYAQYQSYKHEQSAQEGPQGARYFESTEAMEATEFQERFGFSVQGHLNEDELQAVFKVFEQVDQLANEFFEGDIEKAFEKAVELEVDFGQIASFSLDMKRSETMVERYQQASAYQGAQQEAIPTSEQAAKVSDLPPYLQRWQAALEEMDAHFAQAREKLDEMLSGVLSQRDALQQSFETDLESVEGEEAVANLSKTEDAIDANEVMDSGAWYDRVMSFHDRLAEMANLDKNTLKPSGVEIESALPKEPSETPQPEQTASGD